MAKTLEELKAENAAEELAEESKLALDTKDNINDEHVETTDDTKADDIKLTSEDDDENKVELESWQLTEDAETSEDDHKSGFVPNHEAATKRKKAQALKGELKEVKTENEELLARIAALESGKEPQKQAPQEQVNQLAPRPTREQFDYDDDLYDVAVDKWNDEKLDLKINSHYQSTTQKQQQDSQAQTQQVALKKNLDDHYGRAAELVAEGKVSEDSYKNADRMVRMSMDNIAQGRGDAITDALISTLNDLGAGSEKVMYQLGVNPAKLDVLKSKLTSDPSGFSAAAYLGQLQSQVQTPSKRRSQAPAPGEDVNGESGNNGKGGTLQKQYSKSTDVNDRVTMKRQAKAQGIDVSNW